MKKKTLIIILLITATILIIPLILMQFTDEVNWAFFDFVIAGVLLFGAGLICDFALRKLNKKYHILALVAIIVIFLLIWAELAISFLEALFSGQLI